jgi:hypothetical protein
MIPNRFNITPPLRASGGFFVAAATLSLCVISMPLLRTTQLAGATLIND